MGDICEITKSSDQLSWEQEGIQPHHIFWIISGIATVIASSISFRLIYKHFKFYYKPENQRYIVRVLLIVPIYSIVSWFSFRYYQHATYFEIIRDFYEAVVIYSFFNLIMLYLGEDVAEQAACMSKKKPMKFIFPLNCFTYNPADPYFLWNCRLGALQYMVIRIVTTTLAAILESVGQLCPQSLAPNHANLYLMSLNFAAVTIAMYALVTLYMTVREDIADKRPILKFLSVKAVLFFSFWQQVLIAILDHYNIIKETAYWTQDNVSNGILSFMICLEMVGIAILHTKAFSYLEFCTAVRKEELQLELGEDIAPARLQELTVWNGIKDAFNPVDLCQELLQSMRHVAAMFSGRVLSDLHVAAHPENQQDNNGKDNGIEEETAEAGEESHKLKKEGFSPVEDHWEVSTDAIAPDEEGSQPNVKS